MSEDEAKDDEEARRRRAAALREQIEAAQRGGRPTSPRDFTDRAAREAAEEEGENGDD
jgi:hypothetical protein